MKPKGKDILNISKKCFELKGPSCETAAASCGERVYCKHLNGTDPALYIAKQIVNSNEGKLQLSTTQAGLTATGATNA